MGEKTDNWEVWEREGKKKGIKKEVEKEGGRERGGKRRNFLLLSLAGR